MLTADCALALGAGTVIITGSGERLARARAMGFATVDYRPADPVEAVRRLTGGKGAQVAIDTGGTTASIRQVVDVLANRNTMEEVLPLIVSERVRVKPLVTHTFALADYGEALRTFAERIDGALKVLVQPGR